MTKVILLVFSTPTMALLYLMAGYLNNPTILEDAPIIYDIAYDPKKMPDNDPNTTVLVKTYISDINGLNDIQKVSFDHIINGYENSDYNQLPVYFAFNPNDNGEYGDEAADDDIYTIRGEPGGAIDTLKQMDIRIAVQDYSHTITIADVALYVGAVTDVENRNKKGFIETYELHQNYPNPFNPSTAISYQLPLSSLVMLKVYDVLGNEITVLENKKKPAGFYKVEFDTSHLSNGIYFCNIQVHSSENNKKFFRKKNDIIEIICLIMRL